MMRPPRDLKKDRLMSLPLFMYSYVVMGLMEGILPFMAYIIVFAHHGLQLDDIAFTNDNYFNFDLDNTFTSNGRAYSPAFQKTILAEANAAWFFNIVMCQFWHIWFVRFRYDSVFQRNPFQNAPLLFGVVLEARNALLIPHVEVLIAHSGVDVMLCLQLAIMVIVIWTPGVSNFFQADPFPAAAIVPNIFFLVWVATITEIMKFRVRHDPTACQWLAW
jgi:magnesium-transporting ATPase (P-type)